MKMTLTPPNSRLPVVLAWAAILCSAAALGKPEDVATETAKPTEAMARFVAFCDSNACRRNVDFSVTRKDGSTYHFQSELMPPAVQPSVVQVLPGETIAAVPLFTAGKFTGWREAKTDEPLGTPVIRIHLAQDDKSHAMIAKIENSGSTGIRLELMMFIPDTDDKPHDTSSCPIAAKNSNFETWPHPIHSLIVRAATIQGAKDDGACR